MHSMAKTKQYKKLMYKCYFDARSLTHCCYRKAKSITYSDCVSLALVMQRSEAHAQHFIVACPALYFSTLSLTQSRFSVKCPGEKKSVFRIYLQLLSEVFLIPSIIQPDGAGERWRRSVGPIM